MTPTSALFGLFVTFVVTWIGAALWAKHTVVALPNRALLPLYVSALVAGLLLVMSGVLFPALRVRLWEENVLFDWAMVAINAIGLGWCWWARIHLGDLWSAGPRFDPGPGSRIAAKGLTQLLWFGPACRQR